MANLPLPDDRTITPRSHRANKKLAVLHVRDLGLATLEAFSCLYFLINLSYNVFLIENQKQFPVRNILEDSFFF